TLSSPFTFSPSFSLLLFLLSQTSFFYLFCCLLNVFLMRFKNLSNAILLIMHKTVIPAAVFSLPSAVFKSIRGNAHSASSLSAFI
ncbi:hypothetical protein, partial [Escherichia coli]|uniref:hypothetical protein n=1 Tax=Escherichia coli TaxID=562 RepID=UPI002915C651